MKLITAQDISKIGFNTLFRDAIRYLEEDIGRWQEFKKSVRHATHFEHGVFELMPCADEKYYTYKYVNAHPANPSRGKLSIVALGMLADVATGYPQMVCDMTLLTALRTAAMSAVAAKHLARKDSRVLGLIGTGAQSEFQTHAMLSLFDIEEIRHFDRDTHAIEKYARNMSTSGMHLIACKNAEEVVQGIDILSTCICEKTKVELFPYEAIRDARGLYINAIGGDCPGKTELDPQVLRNARIVVEYFEQTKEEGEIQNLKGEVFSHDELWEVVQHKKPGRIADELIVFDSVGFGLADFSVMRMLYERGIGDDTELLPRPRDSKDLFSIFSEQVS